MSTYHDIDPAQAAQITERIGYAFDFVQDAIAAPEILNEIPDGSELVLREIVWQGQPLHMVAHPAKDNPNRWVSRVTAPADIARTSLSWVHPIEHHGKGGKWGSPPTFPESGPTAEAALDALEEKLRDADHPGYQRRRVAGG